MYDFNMFSLTFTLKDIKEDYSYYYVNLSKSWQLQIFKLLLTNAVQCSRSSNQWGLSPMSRYVALIESIAANLTVPAGNTSRDLLSPNLLIKVVLPNMATFTKHGYRLASRAASSQVGDSLTADTISTSELPASQVQTGIFLPPGIARRFDNTSGSPVRFALAIYQNHKLFQTVSDDDEDDDGVSVGWSVNSRVISSSVVGVPMNNLTEPIVTTFEPLEQSDMFPECAFWDFVANGKDSVLAINDHNHNHNHYYYYYYYIIINIITISITQF